MSKKMKASCLLLQGLYFLYDFKLARCYDLVWTLVFWFYILTIPNIVTIYRQGSGSACRSLFGGFVKWKMGKVSILFKSLWALYHLKIHCNLYSFDIYRRRMEVIVLRFNLLMKSIGMNLLLLLLWYVIFFWLYLIEWMNRLVFCSVLTSNIFKY